MCIRESVGSLCRDDAIRSTAHFSPVRISWYCIAYAVQNIAQRYLTPGTRVLCVQAHFTPLGKFEMVDEETKTLLDVSSLLFDDTGSSKQARAQLELPTWDYNYESHVPFPVVSSGVPLDYRVQV